MLTSVLPGFRKVRTPLVTGYLYCAVLWLIFGSELIPDGRDHGFTGKIAELFERLGPTAVTAALSVTAYLMGSTLIITGWPFARTARGGGRREGLEPTLPVVYYRQPEYLRGQNRRWFDIRRRPFLPENHNSDISDRDLEAHDLDERESVGWALLPYLASHEQSIERLLLSLDESVTLRGLASSKEVPFSFYVEARQILEQEARDGKREELVRAKMEADGRSTPLWPWTGPAPRLQHVGEEEAENDPNKGLPPSGVEGGRPSALGSERRSPRVSAMPPAPPPNPTPVQRHQVDEEMATLYPYGRSALVGDEAVHADALLKGFLAVLPGEIGRVAATVRVRYPALWDEYDQLRSEAELRYSIVPPLTLISLIGTLTWTPWAILTMVGPLVLAWQGVRSERSSINSIMDIIDADIVIPPAIEALRRLASEQQAPGSALSHGGDEKP
ncbi:hypothetical protein [Terrabacter sp. C0L_2]|uniref:hypothetical protein n=1 Tax=Terrabacter sp. C0L_2 TaxID=3108389 RepID=UPI002ED3D8C6|nr:hypothetical protein U5C87_06480 [Terrabacter sp. C0L_2]